MKAIIPAAGLGTEFIPATKAQPTEMLPVYDKPSIQYVVEEAIASGIDDIIIITAETRDPSRIISTSHMSLNTASKRLDVTVTLKKSGK